MKLSKLTLALGAYIVLSACFMQQVWVAVQEAFGIKTILFLLAAVSVIVFMLILWRSLKRGTRMAGIAAVTGVFAVAFLFAMKQPYMSEKTHVLEYGLLGWLALRDLSKRGGVRVKGMICALIFIIIVGCLDEGFQKIIPWRVGEVRDVATNVVSGVFGVILYVLG